ncbi:M23 family metallopeptidase [Thermosyntropha sp.]|uniref:M23 family metallopeptidase n=1 Tax=Thermosyntropha sp. TaxID=2740820 RepID=UPI0025F15C32|nr:M23 family metallopeptidase [Thermosyntropha sp.]MBO8159669.1 peptidoglycan DD-metalloendopeptidase family protein [Thermosyntropha sp.]
MTVLFIPPTGEKAKKFNVSDFFIKGAAAALALIVLISLTFAGLYFNSQYQVKQVNKLKTENEEKEETIKILNEEIKEIEEQKEEIARKQEEIKKLMGITDSTGEMKNPSRGGKGRRDIALENEEGKDALEKLQEIKTYLNREEQRLDEMLAKAQNNQDYFRAVPNQWPVKGEITSPFGWRESPFGGRKRTFHEGIDIANNVGETIVAAADGKVTFAGWRAVYGKTVEIEHRYGFVTIYGHNSVLLVEKGDEVKKGQPIARLGNTGRSTGPHLHFTVKKYGKLVDPLVYLP